MSVLFGPTGFFTYLFDRKCFEKENASRFNRISNMMSTEKLWEFARNAHDLKEGICPELLIELAKRKDS